MRTNRSHMLRCKVDGRRFGGSGVGGWGNSSSDNEDCSRSGIGNHQRSLSGEGYHYSSAARL